MYRTTREKWLEQGQHVQRAARVAGAYGSLSMSCGRLAMRRALRAGQGPIAHRILARGDLVRDDGLADGLADCGSHGGAGGGGGQAARRWPWAPAT